MELQRVKIQWKFQSQVHGYSYYTGSLREWSTLSILRKERVSAFQTIGNSTENLSTSFMVNTKILTLDLSSEEIYSQIIKKLSDHDINVEAYFEQNSHKVMR